MNLHIEENVAQINKMWFMEILDYCDSESCEPSDLIKAHKTLKVLKEKQIGNPVIKYEP